MKLPISASIDLSTAELEELQSCFPEDHFEVRKEIFKPGIDTSFVLLNFVLPALAGGLLYDAFKEGILRLYRSTFPSGRKKVITIKSGEKFFRIKGEEISEMDPNGKFIEVPDIETLMGQLDEGMDQKEEE